MEWRRVVQCDQCGESSFVHGVHFEYTKDETGYHFQRAIVTAKCPLCGDRDVAIPLPVPGASNDHPSR